MNFWTRSERIPPILVRLLARRKHGPPLSDREIAEASSLPIHQVFCISQSLTWDGIDLPTMRKFLTGCKVDFENTKQMDRVEAYLRIKPAPSWQHLRMSPDWLTFYAPLIRRYRETILKPQTKW
jgi:hypothetical protein